jgi:hypothetical protein
VRGIGSSEGCGRGRFVERDDPERLQAARPLRRLDHDARPLMGGLVAVPAQARDVQENIRHAVVGQDESEPLGDVEPLDAAAHLDKVEGLLGRGLFAPQGVARRTPPDGGHRIRTEIVRHEPDPLESRRATLACNLTKPGLVGSLKPPLAQARTMLRLAASLIKS